MEGILNDFLGLPPNFLKDYNNDRCLDILLSYRYFPATETEDNGATSHQDPAVLSLIFQDDAGGLEVLIDREWIPVTPTEGALVFHISDVLQVTKKLLINKSYKMKCFRFDCINFILANCLNVCMANWQVLTNDRFVSHFHQVVRPKGKSRNVFVFFYNLNGDKWVEPLPQFSKEIGEPPKYRRFQYKDYFGVRVKEKLNPPARHEDNTTLITFASAT